MIVTVTGLMGSGKSTVAGLLGRKGAIVVAVDEIGKEVLNGPAKKTVLAYFGRQILRNGKIDAKHLADIVFRDRRKLLKLHELTHQYIKQALRGRIRKDKINVIDAALYKEFDLHKISDYTVLVKAPLPMKIRRLRGVHDKSDILRRMKFQTYVKNPDFVIDNSGNFENLDDQVAEVWERIEKG